MHQPQAMTIVGADVYPHPEVPRVALAHLLHLGVPRLRRILRRAWRTENRGIHNRALAQDQTRLGQQMHDFVEQALGQVMGFQQ